MTTVPPEITGPVVVILQTPGRLVHSMRRRQAIAGLLMACYVSCPGSREAKFYIESIAGLIGEREVHPLRVDNM
jgi:hypothetical protein